jgi:hypothetical protein
MYGRCSNDSFTTYQIDEYKNITKLNLELKNLSDDDLDQDNHNNNYFGRIIFYTSNVGRLYTYFKTNKSISNIISIENEPVNAPWNERYFHIRQPDVFQLSFAQPIKST